MSFLKSQRNILFNLALLLFLLCAGGIISNYLGFDYDWDTRDYHLYNPYAFLNGRIGFDIMPASIMSYYNPLLDMFFYLVTIHLNDYPNLAAFILGLSYGLLLYMVFKISEIVFNMHPFSKLLSFLTMFLCSTSLCLLVIVGRPSHDIFEAFLILLSLWLLLYNWEKKGNCVPIILSGIVMGAVVGFKYIYAPAAIGAFLALCFYRKLFKNPYKDLLIFSLSGACGFLIVNGFWMLELYQTFGNPIMPHFSEIFKNEWINSAIKIQNEDANYCSHIKNSRLWILLTNHLKDDRYLLVYIVFVLNLFIWKKGNNDEMKKQCGINAEYGNFLLLFSIFFIIFIFKMAIIFRYMLPVIALSGILVVVFIHKFLWVVHLRKHLYRNAFILILCIFSVAVLHYDKDGYKRKMRRYPIREKVFIAQDANIPDNAIVMVVPTSGIVVPYQNPKARYVYFPEYRWIKVNVQIFSDEGYKKLRSYINAQKDNTYLLSDISLTEDLTKRKVVAEVIEHQKLSKEELIKNYGVSPDVSNDCTEIKTNRTPYYLCKLEITD